jgi:shikimate kinase
MNLVLIGYRGTGKSTVGKLLSDELNLRFVSLDDEIVVRAGLSIPEIVDQESWDYFRDLEEEVVGKFASRDGQLLDTGGGVVTREKNIARLRKNGLVVLLESTVEDILLRIGGDDERPSLTGIESFTEEVEQVLSSRRNLYESAADFTVNTSERSPEEAASDIAAIFREELGRRTS